jgi:hypothetical protein
MTKATGVASTFPIQGCSPATGRASSEEAVLCGPVVSLFSFGSVFTLGFNLLWI